MALSKDRIVVVGETPHAHEAAAVKWVNEQLPDVEPFHTWALFDLYDPSTGRSHEIDILVLGYSALYVVEVKSHPGTIEGDSVDWRWTRADGSTGYIDPPYSLTNLKAKVLKTRLQQKLGRDAPWVEALVFLSSDELTTKFRDHGDNHVVTRKNFLNAVQRHDFPGADKRSAGRIDRPLAHKIARALSELGVRARKGKTMASGFQLGDVIAEGSGYQDREATRPNMQGVRARARTYLVPEQTTPQRKSQLRRAADREYRVLYHLRECPGVLQVTGYDDQAPLGPTVLFDDFNGSVPLDVFLRGNPELDFSERILLIEKIARSLAACHDRQVIHGALSPSAVLVRYWEKLETRLFNFQLSRAQEVDSTLHWSALADDPWVLYQAPELRHAPTKLSVYSDIFSLGALAFLVLTGKAPGKDLQEVETTLHRDASLDPRRVTDSIPKEAADAIVYATDATPISRPDSVTGWLELLLDAVTSPPQPAEEFVNPLVARKGDLLSRDLRVVRELGSGASSRVLEVERDGRPYALKVSLDTEQDERLKAEAEVLRKLAHAPVATLQEELTLQGRTCLLLSVAGSTTLQRFLAAEGCASADIAARYGKDLLSALEELEAVGITHRDIKPANIGVGAQGHGRKRLILFDFSLTGSSATSVGIGTAVYRDPYLAERGAWDAAADRWSAAVTLHELLTGVRPHYEAPEYTDERGEQVPQDGDAAPTDKHAQVVLAAERFDPQLRGTLTEFFRTAFAPAIEQRFTDAAQMRRRWESCFDTHAELPSQPHAAEPREVSGPGERAATPAERLSDEQIANIPPESFIASLPLTSRAKNALDRMGLLSGAELLTLPENRLSIARGVGRTVAQEIVAFVSRWRSLRPMSAAVGAAFFPNYRGEDTPLKQTDLSGRATNALEDAGLLSLAQVADAPKAQVELLVEKAFLKPSQLEALLTAAHKQKQDQFNSVEGVLAAFIPKQKKRSESVELLFGLREPFLGRLDVSIKEVAEHRGTTRTGVYIPLGKCRDEWASSPSLGNLQSLVRALVAQHGGAIRADRFAQRLLAELPHDRRASPELTRAQAAAWARIVCEAEANDEEGMRWVRLPPPLHPSASVPWICESELLGDRVYALGELAAALGELPVLASPAEAQRRARAVVLGTPLERLPNDKLLALAADASPSAALSPRLEIYPRGMDAKRALELTVASLPIAISAGDLQAHVRARYPAAARLPDAPALDALMAPHGYNFDGKVYRRPLPDHQTASTQNTANSVVTQLDVAHEELYVPAEQPAAGDAAAEAGSASSRPARKASISSPKLAAIRADEVQRQAFVERLRQTLERDAYRVLGVHIPRAAEAALALSRYLGVKPVLLDQLLVERMTPKVPLRAIHAADREGPAGSAWPNLLRVADRAAKELADELLPNKQPLLLAQPGLLARYELKDFLLRLAEASKQDEAKAILLLVPTRERAGMPVINNQLAIPGVLPTHTFWVSRTWLDQQGARAAE